MEIVNDYPPNWEQIKSAFPVDNAEVVMTYGDKIYNPFQLPLRDDLIAHEEVHMRQQKHWKSPDEFWQEYMANPQWRVAIEIEAYGRQLAFIRQKHGPKAAAQALNSFAKFISSAVYGNAISSEQAVSQLSKISRR